MKHRRLTKRLKRPSVRRPQIPHAIKRRLPGRRRRNLLDNPLEALSDLPRITNETVAEHREEILSSARKYIYPLQHSRGRIIKVSAGLLAAAVVAFFAYCGLALYKFQSTSTFIYEVTRVIPFPVARVGTQMVSYENYLFELRHLTHYYETQQKEDFRNESGARHLAKLKQDSLQQVIDDAYVKQLAAKHHIQVSGREVEDQIAMVKSQNRLGSSDQMLSDVLKQFWGWSLDDFKRQLRTQLLAQKVASELDTADHARAANALAELRGGADFAAIAAKVSDDPASKSKGGAYPGPIAKINRDVPPQVVDALFRLQPGQVSDVIDTGYSLEIIKNLGPPAGSADKLQAAHISIKLQPITTYVAPLRDAQKPQHFIKV